MTEEKGGKKTIVQCQLNKPKGHSCFLYREIVFWFGLVEKVELAFLRHVTH